MQLTQKIRIEPTIAQQVVLDTLSEKCRLIYNFALSERKKSFEQDIKGINYLKQQNDLPNIKEQYPEYKWVYSHTLQYILRNLDADYKSFFALWKRGDRNARLPRFKSSKYFTTMTFNHGGFKAEKGYFTLSHKHPSKTALRFAIPEKFTFSKIIQVSVFKQDENYNLSIVYEKEAKEYKDNELYQAFDLGVIKHTCVNLSGKFKEFFIPKSDKYWQTPTEQLQSRVAHCKRGSIKQKKLRKILNKCKRKCSNQLKDFQHKLSTKIINNTKANTIIVGDLPIKNMCKKGKHKKGLHRSLHNTGNINRFVQFLTYKAELMGKRIIKIDERDTSKTCCVCGRIQAMPLWKRRYKCECGNDIDRDKNSSVKILMRYLSQNGLWLSCSTLKSNLRYTEHIDLCYSQEASPLGVK